MSAEQKQQHDRMCAVSSVYGLDRYGYGYGYVLSSPFVQEVHYTGGVYCVRYQKKISFAMWNQCCAIQP